MKIYKGTSEIPINNNEYPATETDNLFSLLKFCRDRSYQVNVTKVKIDGKRLIDDKDSIIR